MVVHDPMSNTPSRRERKKDKTRQLLVDAAIRLIGERGIYGTRVEDITERCDLGKGAFYNYFESKDRLIADLVAHGIDIIYRDYLRDIPPSAPQSDRVAAVIAAHDAFFDEHPVYVVLFHQARGLAKMKTGTHEPLAEVFAGYLRRTCDAIVSPADRASVDDASLLDVAAILLGAIAGYRSFRIAGGLELSSSHVTRVMVSGIPPVLAARMGEPS